MIERLLVTRFRFGFVLRADKVASKPTRVSYVETLMFTVMVLTTWGVQKQLVVQQVP